MAMDGRAIVFSVVVAMLYVAANVLTEKSLEPGKTHLMGVVFLLAIVAFLGFRWCCQQFGLAIASTVVDSLLTLLTVGYAVFILKDRLTSIQYVGIVLMIVGLLLVKGPWSGEAQASTEASANNDTGQVSES
jgi:drug/metabolite transporter (DMT)-like permease